MAVNNTVITSAPSDTVISAQTTFKGSIITDKALTIDGNFEGEIKSTNLVFVNACGTINATIECQDMKMFGKGTGSIFCSSAIEFGPSAEFDGDVVTKEFLMASGAKLEGRCRINK